MFSKAKFGPPIKKNSWIHSCTRHIFLHVVACYTIFPPLLDCRLSSIHCLSSYNLLSYRTVKNSYFVILNIFYWLCEYILYSVNLYYLQYVFLLVNYDKVFRIETSGKKQCFNLPEIIFKLYTFISTFVPLKYHLHGNCSI